MQLGDFSSLLSKKMTRSEFLLHLGLLLLVVTGITGVLNTLSDPNLVKKKNKKVSSGFGGGPYGA